jgi:hypothetical protein
MAEWSKDHVTAIGSLILNFFSCWNLVKLETGWGL